MVELCIVIEDRVYSVTKSGVTWEVTPDSVPEFACFMAPTLSLLSDHVDQLSKAIKFADKLALSASWLTTEPSKAYDCAVSGSNLDPSVHILSTKDNVDKTFPNLKEWLSDVIKDNLLGVCRSETSTEQSQQLSS